MSLAILCPDVIRAEQPSNVSSVLNIEKIKELRSTAKNADSQEEWIYVGEGVWTDALWLSDGSPYSTSIKVEKNLSTPGLYRADPFGEWVNIHTEDPNKVYVEDYINTDTNGTEIKLSQLCAENSWRYSFYGTITGETITIPGNCFRYFAGSEWHECDPDRECKIILPKGCDSPLINQNGVFMGLVGFGALEDLDQKPISLLDESSKTEFTSFVNDLEMSNGTLLYYAVDTAIDNLIAPLYPENLSNAVLITFTDGIDQGSLGIYPEYRTDTGYASYLSERITNTSIQGHPLQSYAIGLKGDDVVNDELFMYNLQSLASSPENAISVDNIEGLQEQLTRIYDNLDQQLTQRIISIAVPMMSHGSTHRFTLDGTSENPEESNLWFEGVFNIDNLSLENVKYNGFSSASGTTLTATKDGIYVIFSLYDCKDENGDILSVEKDDIDQWIYVESHNVWQHNVENDKEGAIQIDDIKSSAVIIFALDCSTSLGDSFPIVKKTANSFIRKLAGEIVAFEPTSIDPADGSELEELKKIILSFDKYYFENGLKITDGAKIEIKSKESDITEYADIIVNRDNPSYPDVYRVTINLPKTLTEEGTYIVTIPKGTIIEYDDRFSSPEIVLTYTIKNDNNSVDILSYDNQKLTVYNIAGVIVMTNATTDDLKKLSPGVYIVNGKKLCITK